MCGEYSRSSQEVVVWRSGASRTCVPKQELGNKRQEVDREAGDNRRGLSGLTTTARLIAPLFAKQVFTKVERKSAPTALKTLNLGRWSG